MITPRGRTSTVALIAAALGLAAASYVAWVVTAWYRFGRAPAPRHDELDPLLEDLLPEYEVAERHQIRVAATPDVTLAAAAEANIQESALVRGIFKARDCLLGAEPDVLQRPKGLLANMQSLGWRILAETPGREIVVGAVTQPWLPSVVFRGLSAEEFRSFREPGFAKIAWTLRADPVGAGESIFRTETRVTTTDPTASRLFRWYWARFSPGIVLIRRVMLRRLKRDAERGGRVGAPLLARPE